MNTESREQLSSLMDGEITPDAARFLVRRLAADDGLRETWSRYHLIRDCLQQQDGALAAVELGQRVRGALAEEPGQTAAGRRGGWFRPAVGTAIAASVALAAVLVIAPGEGPAPESLVETPAGTAAAEPFVSPNIRGLVPSSQPVNLSGTEGNDGREINAYLLRHYQVTGSAGGRGFVSFVPIVVTQGVAAQTRDPVRSDDATDDDASVQ
jgi:sigma-E factor negative regulatory protein RseA